MIKKRSYDFNLLRALEVFLAVAEYGQMTRAATALGITQSAVSQHLSHLETAYGCDLIDRSLRPIGLTLTGLALQQHALEILHKVESVPKDLNRLEHQKFPLLRIGLLPSLATLLTPVLVARAREIYKVRQISLYADLANTHEQALKSRQVDMVVTSSALYNMDGLKRHPILEESFLLVLPPDHDSIENFAKLKPGLPLIRFATNTPAGLLVDQHLRRCHLEFERSIEADRTTMIMASVAAGLGFAILSPTLLLDGIVEGMNLRIQAAPFKPLKRNIVLVSRNQEIDNVAEDFKTTIRSTLEQAFADKLDQGCQKAVVFL